MRRRTLAPPAGSRVYELTERGAELEPVVLALGRWGSAAPFPDGEARLGVESLVIALKTLFDPARPPEGRFELRSGEHRFRIEAIDGRLDATRGEAGDPAATIEGDPGTLARILWHDGDLAEAERSGAVTIGGSRAAAKRFLGAFPLPG